MLSWRTSDDRPFALPVTDDPAARAAVIEHLVACLTRELHRLH
jgi:hypothetical protein